MFDNGLDASHVTATCQRARERVPSATGPIVFPEFLHAVPPLVIAARRPVADNLVAAADARRRPAVLAPQLHGQHQPVERRLRVARELVAATASRQMLHARRTAHVSVRAQPVRRQRLIAASVTRHQLIDLRTQAFHNGYNT